MAANSITESTTTPLRWDKLQELKVVELQAELKSRGLKESGLKAELVERLKKAIKPVQEAEATNLTVSHEAIQIDESQSETSTDKPVASNVPIVIKPSTSVVQPAHCTCNQKMEKIIADMEDLKQIVFNIPAITKDQQTNMQIELDRLKRENESLITTIKVLSTQLSQRERPVSSDSALEDANIPKQVETHPPLIEIPDEQTSKVNQSKQNPPSKNTRKQQNRLKKAKEANRHPENHRSTEEPTENHRPSAEPNRTNDDLRNNVCIVGDSILKHLHPNKLSSDSFKVKVSTFPGCTTEDMKDYIKPILRKNSPDEMILHVGTNSLRTCTSERSCAEEIIDLASAVEQSEVKVTISAIICRSDDVSLAKKAQAVNKIVKRFSSQNGWGFIEHNTIKAQDHLNRSGLHLNVDGTKELAKSFISYLNKKY